VSGPENPIRIGSRLQQKRLDRRRTRTRDNARVRDLFFCGMGFSRASGRDVHYGNMGLARPVAGFRPRLPAPFPLIERKAGQVKVQGLIPLADRLGSLANMS